MLENETEIKKKIVIIDYGAGNIQSLKFALQRQGFEGVLSKDPQEIAAADKVIFPGVGEAGSAMRKLQETDLDLLIPKLRNPVLGICLGMQLMCEKSEEGNTKGLGIFETEVLKFPDSVKVPQIGWNEIHELESPLFDGVKENEFIYMVHSFYAPTCSETIAKTDYGTTYSAALHKGNFFGLQFHPEKSGKIGERILANFLNLKNLSPHV